MQCYLLVFISQLEATPTWKIGHVLHCKESQTTCSMEELAGSKPILFIRFIAQELRILQQQQQNYSLLFLIHSINI